MRCWTPRPERSWNVGSNMATGRRSSFTRRWLLRLLVRQYEYLVIDAGNQINSCTVAALYAANTLHAVDDVTFDIQDGFFFFVDSTSGWSNGFMPSICPATEAAISQRKNSAPSS